MRVYFAGNNGENWNNLLTSCGVQKYLLSFFELSKSKTSRRIFENLIDRKADILIDSGAHTLQKGKDVVDYDKFVDEYIDFIKQYKNYISAYVELDIENIVGMKRVEYWTQKLINEIGMEPIVVWHRERGVQYWEDMSKKYKYVGFSGFVTTPEGGAELPDKYLPLFLKIAKDNKTKIHGFGYTRFSKPHILKNFYSVDSTSWLTGGKYRRHVVGSLSIRANAHYMEINRSNIFYILEQERKINNLLGRGGETDEN